MSNLNDLLLLLPKKIRNTIEKLHPFATTKNIVKGRNDGTGTGTDSQLSASDVSEFLRKELSIRLYPMAQIIQHISKEPNEQQLEKFLDSMFFDVLENIDNDPDMQAKLYNLITNIFVLTDDFVQSAISALYSKRNELNQFIYLSLLAREDSSLLNIYLLYEYEQSTLMNKKTILHNAIQNQQHILSKYFLMSTIPDIIESNTKNIMIISKTLYDLNLIEDTRDCDPYDFEQTLKKVSVKKLTEVHQLFYYELCRIVNILKILNKYGQTMTTLNNILNAKTFLEILYKYTNFLSISYDELRNYIENDIKFDKNMNENCKNLNNEILLSFFVMSYVCDMIFSNNKNFTDFEFYIENKLSKINNILRQIRNVDLFIKLIESIFTILFLRWEHIENSFELYNKNDAPLCTDIDTDINLSTKSTSSKIINIGFVCKKLIFEKILYFLKESVVKRIYTEESHENNEKIRQCSVYINDAIWRLTLFQKLNSQNDNCLPKLEKLSNLIVLRTEIREHSSSDDEIPDRNQTNTMRKKKLKRKNTLKKSHSSDTKNKFKNKKETTQIRYNDANSIIGKMLGSPSNLAMVCLNIGDFKNARKIIEKYDLKIPQLENELNFLENYRRAKLELQTTFERYAIQESLNINTFSAIEQIKKVATTGFEALKIISIIKIFIQKNELIPIPEAEYLIEKHCKTYPFLEHFHEKSLQIINIFDLVVNLISNYEISANILNMIERNYGITEQLKTTIQNSRLFESVSCLAFFKNLVDDLFNYKNIYQKSISVKELLNTTFYPLGAEVFKTELEKEKILNSLFSIEKQDLQQIDQYKELIKKFDDLKSETNYFIRFFNYILNIQKLSSQQSKISENFVEKLMLVDVRKIIGNLLFIEKHEPAFIEPYVDALNLNLAHVIALNICPEAVLAIPWRNGIHPICSKLRRESYIIDDQYIFDYINGYSPILAIILQKISAIQMENEHRSLLYLQRIIDMPQTVRHASMYNENTTIAAILSDYLNIKTLLYLEDSLVALDILLTFSENLSIRTCLDTLKEDLVSRIIEKDITFILCIEELANINLRAKILCKNFQKIQNDKDAERIILGILLHKNKDELESSQKNELEEKLKQIETYSEVSKILSLPSWTIVFDINKKHPELILKKLLKSKDYKLACKWLCTIILNTSIYSSIKEKLFFDIILEILSQIEEKLDEHLIKLIESFPEKTLLNFFENNLENFKNLTVLKYVVNYLSEYSKDNPEKYRNCQISLKLFENMSPNELEKNWNLIKRPIIIIEQFVMNSKLEHLGKMLNGLEPLLGNTSCKFCSDKRESIYELPMSSSITLGGAGSSNFLLLNFDLYQKDHIITVECVDTILRIYAAKALNYRVNETYITEDVEIQNSDMPSLDSLCEMFVMPKVAPERADWVRDEETIHCMCCKRAKFTMLTRRHHCRRCGRVVCYSCSENRITIPKLYADVAVRTCKDCFRQTKEKEAMVPSTSDNQVTKLTLSERNSWQFSGNLTHDKLLREEFCYEHAPSVGLCLSILSMHQDDQEYINFLIHHCQKFEKLLRPLKPGYPNPEIDYNLVAKMLNCLALAAKVRGGPSECNIIRDHSDIIMSVVKNGCERILPMELLTDQSLRKLADSLVLVENWPLAFDIFLKCGFNTAGVMAAHGLSCLKAGCFDTAREKFLHCMTRISSDEANNQLLNLILTENKMNLSEDNEIVLVKRPSKSPPLLYEIIKIIETTWRNPQPESLVRASAIRSSNSSRASIKSRRRENIAIGEPAMNVLNTFANLKQIAQGNYCDSRRIKEVDNKVYVERGSRLFEECMHYLFTFGSHVDIINFLMRRQHIACALKYFVLQKVENEIFVNNIFQWHLKRGTVDALIKTMLEIDDSILIWKHVIIQTCRRLEKKGFLNSLYQLQVLLKDPIRASMTCVRFYSMNCSNFHDLHSNAFHLITAQKHLQTELEICQRENLNFEANRTPAEHPLIMQMDAKTINAHINTIVRQLEVVKFLSNCEHNTSTMHVLKEISLETPAIPTLFESTRDKILLCMLILICGKNIDEGFGLTFRIIQDYKLDAVKVYGLTAKYLARHNRLSEVKVLINGIKSNNGNSASDCDDIVSLAVQSATNVHSQEMQNVLENLIKLIVDVDKTISSFIYVGQLKSAYLLAVQNNRTEDIRKIHRQAEITNQLHVKRLCEKKLNIPIK